MLARSRVIAEVAQFKLVVRPKIAGRLHIHDSRAQLKSPGSTTMSSSTGKDKPRPAPVSASQEAVVAYLLGQHLQHRPGLNIEAIARDTRASLPTIYKVLNSYAHCLQKNSVEKTWRLVHFSNQDWLKWMEKVNRLANVAFIDRSGAPRSATRLASKLSKLKRNDLAIGGLLGAMHHLPGLDATGAPQLDILVHSGRRSDLSFVQDLDPGLQRHEGRADAAHVVVHFIDQPVPLFTRQSGQNWGAVQYCVANMHKAGLHHQVQDALHLLRSPQKA